MAGASEAAHLEDVDEIGVEVVAEVEGDGEDVEVGDVERLFQDVVQHPLPPHLDALAGKGAALDALHTRVGEDLLFAEAELRRGEEGNRRDVRKAEVVCGKVAGVGVIEA